MDLRALLRFLLRKGNIDAVREALRSGQAATEEHRVKGTVMGYQGAECMRHIGVSLTDQLGTIPPLS